ncbi:MAG: hypothetical protein KatS3mg110_1024 [Pirellulaceae bacterium]|nr:MAG: hypothetical protein KatS3mg110_1024 [Pirellulaceae bacterium]
MTIFCRAVPVLKVANVQASARWYSEVFGFLADTFPANPPYSFAILRRDGAEIMLLRDDQHEADKMRKQQQGRDFRWDVYLRLADTAVLDLALVIREKTTILRGPERMFYGLVEFEICDPDGHRICISGEPPADAEVEQFVEHGSENHSQVTRRRRGQNLV